MTSSSLAKPEKILCTIGEQFAEEGKQILEELGDVTYATPTQEELPSLVSDVDILVVQLGITFDKDVIDAAENLKVIATATTGLDHIDVEHAESKGITVLSLKGETEFLNTVTATAEHALGLMIALARKLPAAVQSVKECKWDRTTYKGHSLSGQTLGIVGLGRLGKMMQRYGEALGMNVIYTDTNEAGGVALEELLKTADFVSLHVPLMKETERLMNSEMIGLMKPSAYLINTSRGDIVNEDELISALESGNLAGYATDVLSGERSFSPEKANNKLIDYAKTHDNVIITPHIGGTTSEAREATDVFIAIKVKAIS